MKWFLSMLVWTYLFYVTGGIIVAVGVVRDHKSEIERKTFTKDMMEERMLSQVPFVLVGAFVLSFALSAIGFLPGTRLHSSVRLNQLPAASPGWGKPLVIVGFAIPLVIICAVLSAASMPPAVRFFGNVLCAGSFGFLLHSMARKNGRPGLGLLSMLACLVSAFSCALVPVFILLCIVTLVLGEKRLAVVPNAGPAAHHEPMQLEYVRLNVERNVATAAEPSSPPKAASRPWRWVLRLTAAVLCIVMLAGALLLLSRRPTTLRIGSIPQDPARQQHRLRQKLEWNRRTLGEAYDAVGQKDVRWDAHASAALDAAARYFSKAPEPRAAWFDIHNNTTAALEAGCTDPLILYLHARSLADKRRADQAVLQRDFYRAAQAMANSQYPPFRRATALTAAARHLARRPRPSTADKQEVFALVDQATKALLDSAAADETSATLREIWFEIARGCLTAFTDLGLDGEAAMAKLEGALRESRTLETTMRLARADFLIEYAWQIRGTGARYTVKNKDWREFTARLLRARTDLETVWALEPGNWRAATLMLRVELGNLGSEKDVQQWFERAMAENNDNFQACESILRWLHPIWYGSVDRYREFARACRDTENWQAGIPLLIAEAHFQLAAMEYVGPRQLNYFHRADVWRDIVTVHTEYLKRYPYDYRVRSQFAWYSYHCGKPEIAQQQFQALGDNLWWGGHFTEQLMKQARSDTARHMAGLPEAKPFVSPATSAIVP